MGGLQSSPQAGAAQAGFQRPFGDASARRARRKNSSVLAHGWSLAKKTAGAVLPGSLLAEAAAEAGPGRGFRPCSAQSGCSSGLGLSADSLDSNCNYIHLPGDYAPASTALRPLRAKLRLQRASSRLSRESDGLSGGRYPLETELSRKLTLREQVSEWRAAPTCLPGFRTGGTTTAAGCPSSPLRPPSAWAGSSAGSRSARASRSAPRCPTPRRARPRRARPAPRTSRTGVWPRPARS